MHTIIWEMQYLSPLPVSKYCKKCGKKTEYINSGQFRINAQRKYLDVWLIYKCLNCDTTWNVTIYSRISPKSLNSELLDQFHSNDEALAMKYAMDIDILRRNGGEIGLPKYKVIGDSLTFSEAVELHIKTEYLSQIKVSTILRDKLQLTHKAYEDMLTNGLIQGTEHQDLRKCKLHKGIVLIINPMPEGVKFLVSRKRYVHLELS